MALLKIDNLSISYGKNNILKEINMDLNEGEVISLSGDNGCGKSTLLRVIFGDINGLSVNGSVLYRGNNVLDGKFDIQNFRKKIGYVPQDDSFCEETPFKEACYSYKLHSGKEDEEYINTLFDKFNIAYLKNRKLFSKYGSQLSGGEKKMVALIAVLCRKDSDLFLIDEPLNNLDSKNVKTISNMISMIHETNPKACIIIITHCHALPCVNRQYQIENGNIHLIDEEYKCFNCFGSIDEKGYYKV